MNEPETQPKPEAPAQQPSEAAVVCSAGVGGERFKPKGAGAKWKIDDTRSVAAHPGEKNEVMLVYENGERQTCIRLSREAARITLIALIRYIDGAPADGGAPQAA